MDVTLTRNGYNLERRKMYIQNPRHNLRSSVQLLWQQSLKNQPNQIQRQKQRSQQLVKQHYTQAIDRKLQEQLKLNKNTFRVMMAPDMSPNNSNMSSSYRNRSENKQGYYDSLNRQIQQRHQMKSIQYQSPPRGHQKSQLLSRSVFGYDIDKHAFQNQSYLSKILNERLQPYLNKQGKSKGSSSLQKHQSFTINHPISLQY